MNKFMIGLSIAPMVAAFGHGAEAVEVHFFDNGRVYICSNFDRFQIERGENASDTRLNVYFESDDFMKGCEIKELRQDDEVTVTEDGNFTYMGDYEGALDQIGTLNFIEIKAGEVQVFKFKYQSFKKAEKFYWSYSDSTVLVEFTIGKEAGNMDSGSGGLESCKRKEGQIRFTTHDKYASTHCVLKEGETYYLNVHNLDNESRATEYYTLTRG